MPAQPGRQTVAVDRQQNPALLGHQRRAGGADAGGWRLGDAADRRRRFVAARRALGRVAADVVGHQSGRCQSGAGRGLSGQHARAGCGAGADPECADGGAGRRDGAAVCHATGDAKHRRLLAHELGLGRLTECAAAQRRYRQRAAAGRAVGGLCAADAGAGLWAVSAANLMMAVGRCKGLESIICFGM